MNFEQRGKEIMQFFNINSYVDRIGQEILSIVCDDGKKVTKLRKYGKDIAVSSRCIVRRVISLSPPPPLFSLSGSKNITIGNSNNNSSTLGD